MKQRKATAVFCIDWRNSLEPQGVGARDPRRVGGEQEQKGIVAGSQTNIWPYAFRDTTSALST